ncbi:WXG100 family type VII secretion target [Thermomonospora echinospora]|uniref:WXG100 family type VII secretion target n=1 Tax=Thermomonospora echinospora TaxID=1992 RepID=A0A1H6E0Z4_9ACTN|nr:WXG100 family type VII secretion target [Thermomonospora echinospora]SEG90666.1 WXG100 family type VII secretion target [Thermomonospora echinospora]
MSDKRGANIAALEDLSRMFSKHSRNLDALIKDLNGRTVSSTEIWWGPSADRFRSAWQEARTAFERMAMALEEGGQDIKRSQQNIEAATR